MVPGTHAVEVFDHGCAIGCDRPDGFVTLDLLCSEGRKLNLIATDDAHFSEPDHFGGWVMVKAAENTPGALLAALKAGDFHSTQGPELRGITVTDKKITIDSSAASSVIVQDKGTAAKAVHGQSLTKAELPLDRFANSDWLRVSLIDRTGKRAWSDPIWRAISGRTAGVHVRLTGDLAPSSS